MSKERELMLKQLDEAAEAVIEKFNACSIGSKERLMEAKNYATIMELRQRIISAEIQEEAAKNDSARKEGIDQERNRIEKEKIRIDEEDRKERRRIDEERNKNQREIEREKLRIDEEDRKERRRIDEERNQNQQDIELEKIRLERIKIEKQLEIEKIKAAANDKGIKEWIYENSGLLLKGATALAGSMVLTAMVLKFEETGSIRSKVGKDLRIGNPFQMKIF